VALYTVHLQPHQESLKMFVVVYTAISEKIPSAFGGEQKQIEFEDRQSAEALMQRYNAAKNNTAHGVHTAVRIDGDLVLEAPVLYELTDISSVEVTQVETVEDQAAKDSAE
jgi:hypothetical protein